jgi:integrase/recombinase XerD
MKERSIYDDFIDSRIAVNCSPATIAWYRYHFKRLRKWMEAEGKTIERLTPVDIQRFLAWLRGERYSASTVSQAHGAMVTFYRWAVNEAEVLTVDPTAKLRRPTIPDYIPPIVARDYVSHMLATIKLNVWMDHRDKLIINLLFCTGIRAGECARLKVRDVDENIRVLHVIGKGGHHRFTPYPEDLRAPLWTWITAQRPVCDFEELFLTSTRSGSVKGPCNAQTIYWICKRRAAEAAMDFYSPHAYRHGFAVDMLIHGASTRLIQKLLGHSDIKTTERYLNLAPQLIQGMFDEIWNRHPLR